MNKELKKIRNCLRRKNLLVKKKEKNLIVTEQYKAIMKSEDIVLY